MDLNMPVMSGFEAARNIVKRQPHQEYNKSISSGLDELMGYDANVMEESPIYPYMVALSASYLDERLKMQCKDAGFDDWFTSPLKLQDFVDKIVPKAKLKREEVKKEEIKYNSYQNPFKGSALESIDSNRFEEDESLNQ